MGKNKGANRIGRKKTAGKLTMAALQRVWYHIDCGCMVKNNLPFDMMQTALGMRMRHIY